MAANSQAKTCIIGAGTSGIATAKALKAKNIPFDWYEKGSRMGGLWWLGNDNGLNTCYEGVTTNTSKQTMAFSDFPFPPSLSHFPNPAEIQSYLEAYAKKFGIDGCVTFNTTVKKVDPVSEDGVRYRVVLQNEKTGETYTRGYENVVVANGHHWDPAYPDLPGHFTGLTVHAHDYRTNEIARGKRCLVLGVGNSGVDIAAEAAAVADGVWLSSRRGAYVLPRYFLNKIPMDAATPKLIELLPWWLRQRILKLLLWPILKRQRRAGFPMPQHGILQAHVTIHKHLIKLVEKGLVKPRPAIQSVQGKHFTFVDGTTEEVDLLFACTGYNVTFPFLDIDVVEKDGVRLYRNCVHPEHPGLFFVGLLQPIGPMIPLVEVQGRWIADLLPGTVPLPPVAAMWDAIHKNREEVKQRYVASKRHMLEVDFLEYKIGLQLERCPAPASPLYYAWHYLRTILNVFLPQWVHMV